MLLISAVGLTSGVLRQGVMTWYFIFAGKVTQPGAEFILQNWGLLLCLFGIVGGFMGGFLSDKVFQSRRGPPVALLSGFMFVLTVVMAIWLYTSPWLLGTSALLITTGVIAVTSLMSGTAAPDFGGRKATATCSGIVDGFTYLGAGLQSFCLGSLVKYGWLWWPLFLMPFALLGGVLALVIWHELPAATRKYIADVEEKAEIEFIGK
jgi:OPA family glycerol-3-phosphate transporter-like MFS transporter